MPDVPVFEGKQSKLVFFSTSLRAFSHYLFGSIRVFQEFTIIFCIVNE